MTGRSAEKMDCTVRLHHNGTMEEHKVETGSNLHLILKNAGLPVDLQCGGNGTCGKCLVRITGPSGIPYKESRTYEEKKLLGEERLALGYRLACSTAVFDGIEVWLPDSDAKMKITSQGKRRNVILNPIVAKTVLFLDKPSINDQCSDLERLEKAYDLYESRRLNPRMQKNRMELPVAELQHLAATLRSCDFTVTLVNIAGSISAVEPGDTSGTNYGIAFDIGTTSVVGYLVNLNTGLEEGVRSAANPQRFFGADVISRISYTMNDPVKLAEMNRAIIDEINEMIDALAKEASISSSAIYAASFAGNTTMMHFLMKIPADGIALAPFIPVVTDLNFITARDLGIRINDNGKAVIFPSVSAYVGADTVAAVLSTGMYQAEEISLLVDIGTNGEIVLGNRDGMVACSAAAGPAFEGAGIHNGVSSVAGAIDQVRLLPELEYTTIGGTGAVGICGSGIVDAVAEMLRAGIINKSGKFIDPEDSCYENSILRNRIIKTDGLSAFVLAKQKECDAGMDIAVTQKDVREVQNAKAAIAAGIRILSHTSGTRLEAVKKVYLAGGFGSYMNIDNAIQIGLLPEELEGRIEAVGNASGTGAAEGLISWEALWKTKTIKSLIQYIELSYSKEFLNEYMECMKLGKK
jgi:uncharacterized 2Fe-2S/4Fe-4S cluster protein (DUF4445 family)